MNILITGAFGFVGTNLSAYLSERGYELWALDLLRPLSGRNGESKNEGGTGEGTLNVQRSTLIAQVGMGKEVKAQHTRREGDYARCFTWEELEKIPWGEVGAVIHLAGKAHDTRNASDPKSYFNVNVGLTEKIVSALVHYCGSALVGEQEAVGNDSTHARMNSRTKELPKFIFFSSVKAVADRVEGVLTEEAVPDPKTPYGQSKLEAEKVVRSALLRYCGSALVGEQEAIGNDSTHVRMNSRTNEILYYILRPCMIHGPGNKGNLNLLYSVVRRGIPWPLGAFENRRSFAAIENVCAVVEGLLRGNVMPGVYQVADDKAISTTELIRLMAEAAGRRARIWRVPVGLMRGLVRIGDVLRLPLNCERLNKLTESYVVSNEKIKKALGWERMPVDARGGLRRTLIATTQWSQWGK